MKIRTLILFLCLLPEESFSQDSFKIVPQPTFQFESLKAGSRDTLLIITCAEYVYSPFGPIKKISNLPSSLLGPFKVSSKRRTMVNGTFEFYSLQMDSSSLLLFFDDDKEAERGSYIIKGQIKDSRVRFINGVKIGMGIASFINVFFSAFPEKLALQCKKIIFESCLDGTIRHTYEFQKGRLRCGTFDSPSRIWQF